MFKTCLRLLSGEEYAAMISLDMNGAEPLSKLSALWGQERVEDEKVEEEGEAEHHS